MSSFVAHNISNTFTHKDIRNNCKTYQSTFSKENKHEAPSSALYKQREATKKLKNNIKSKNTQTEDFFMSSINPKQSIMQTLEAMPEDMRLLIVSKVG